MATVRFCTLDRCARNETSRRSSNARECKLILNAYQDACRSKLVLKSQFRSSSSRQDCILDRLRVYKSHLDRYIRHVALHPRRNVTYKLIVYPFESIISSLSYASTCETPHEQISDASVLPVREEDAN